MEAAEVRGGREETLGAAILVLGAVAVAVAGLGPIAMVAIRGFTPYGHVVDGLTASSTGALLLVAIGMGAGAIAAGAATFRSMPTKPSRERAISGAILGVHAVTLAALLLWFRSGDPERFAFHFLNFEKLSGYGFAFLRGAKNTVLLAFVGEGGGVILGLVLAILVLSKRAVTRAPARAYINFFRGTPLIWQLSIFYFGFALGLGLHLSAYNSAMIVFALNTGAYAAEVFRAGIQSIERGQMEAARSLGMSYLQAMRHAIVPQAIRRVIPPLMNEFVILIKDTSLIVVLGLLDRELDLYSLARQGYSSTFNATFYVAAAAGYLAVTLPLIRAVNAVERRLRSGLVGVGA
ncbi:MAG TPA: amino acid ABC transporter permease [Actinomycetota bacterium]|nr:amino acid ABC transporter permease [Actinomycetota bacterium]